MDDKIIVEAVFGLMFRSMAVDLVTLTNGIRTIYKRNGESEEEINKRPVGQELVRRIFDETPLYPEDLS